MEHREIEHGAEAWQRQAILCAVGNAPPADDRREVWELQQGVIVVPTDAKRRTSAQHILSVKQRWNNMLSGFAPAPLLELQNPERPYLEPE